MIVTIFPLVVLSNKTLDIERKNYVGTIQDHNNNFRFDIHTIDLPE